jgi:ketosteroid isomerase-like protein
VSQENVELVRDIYAQWARGDMRAGVEVLDPELVFESQALPDSDERVVAHGPAELETWMRGFLTQWADYRLIGEEFRDAGPKVFVAGRQTARGRQSGARVEQELWSVWTFRAGKVVRLESTSLRRQALEAAGLPEDNVEIVRTGYDHFRRTGGLRPDRWAEDAVFDNSEAIFAAPGVYRGRDQIAEFMLGLGDMWRRQRYEPEGFIPAGADQVVVPQRIVSVGRDGVEVVARTALLYTLREGKITHVKNFQSEAEAVRAAGLSE